MSSTTVRARPGMWALDIALLLLGLLVLFMVFRLLRFDDPSPIMNAWTYVIGVPSVLIATSMITRVLTNETVEKSIQIGFLASVGIHLLLMMAAVKLVLFDDFFPSDQKIRMATSITKVKTSAPQYFEPTKTNSDYRPDYLKPVETENAKPTQVQELLKRPEEPSKLDLAVARDNFEPELAEKPFDQARKEASPSQPTITSTAQKQDRPDTVKGMEQGASTIEVPRVSSDPSTVSNEPVERQLDTSQSAPKIRSQASISNSFRSEATFDLAPRQFDTKPTIQKDNARSEPSKELDIAIQRIGEALPNRPDASRPLASTSLSLPSPALSSSVPVPQLSKQPSEMAKSNAADELERAMSGRDATRQSRIGTNAGGSSLSSAVGGLPSETNGSALTAPFLDAPKIGMDAIKRDVTMPEIKDVDVSVDRFRRPDVGGPTLSRSAVPIPTPAFSQRLRRNREQQDDKAVDLGPLGPQTEEAIELGLEFLSKYQRQDGSWHLEDFGERVELRSDTAATALSLLSFQGAGYTHKQFKYENVCAKALKWMTANQRPNGDLYIRMDAKSDNNAWLYSHAIATLALCETFGMTQDQEIKDNAQRAINFLVQSQDPQAGGWRYQPRIGSDTSVTGWCMMALKSAELSGLEVPPSAYAGILKWLKNSQASEQQKYLYRYNWQAPDNESTRHGRVPTPVMTSVGLLMRLYLGWKRDNNDMMQGTDWLLGRLPSEGTAANPQRDTYYWYYATQVLFHMGGERWKKWYGSLYPMLIQSQNRRGEYLGSWEPNGQVPDAWGRFGGRLYVTTLNLLSLEVYYRHLPIYEATAD